MTLSRVPRAGPQVRAGSPCEIQACVHVHPRLCNYLSPTSFTPTALPNRKSESLFLFLEFICVTEDSFSMGWGKVPEDVLGVIQARCIYCPPYL